MAYSEQRSCDIEAEGRGERSDLRPEGAGGEAPYESKMARVGASPRNKNSSKMARVGASPRNKNSSKMARVGEAHAIRILN